MRKLTLKKLPRPETMKKNGDAVAPAPVVTREQIKAVLRGGTFHRVQVLLQNGDEYLEHCGLNYRVTKQKDANGRIMCVWCK